MGKRAGYRIEEAGNRLYLCRRRLGFLWVPVESRSFVYSRHRTEIIRGWVRRFGAESFFPQDGE